MRLEVLLLQRIRTGSAAVAVAASGVLATFAQAQTVVVTGTREPLAAERLAGDVAVIDAATIRDTSADSVADLLRREAGVQLSRNGGPGQNTGVMLRGAYSAQTVVLVDGVRIGSATTGQTALESLPLAQVERIEVLRGPGSSLYGADPIGGVVQVFTRRGEPGLQLDARAALGGYASGTASLAASHAAGAWDMAASLSGERSGGVSALRPGDLFGNYDPDRDGYRLDAAQAQLGYAPAAGQRVGLTLLRTKINTQYDGSEFPPPTFAQDNSADFRTRLDTEVSALDWRGSLATGLTGSARAARSVDDTTSGGTQTERFRSVRDRFGAQLALDGGATGQWVGAVEQTNEDAQTGSYQASRRDFGVVLALTGRAGDWAWQSDLRHDDSSDYGSVGTARLGGSYSPTPAMRLRALAGTTFRAPSFNDLYFPGYGVPTLRPERGRSVEAGLSWRAPGALLDGTVYYNRVRDLIGYQADRSLCPSDPAYDFGCAGNIGRAHMQGATLAARQRSGAWTARAQVDVLEARDDDTGQRLPRRAAHQETLSLDWSNGAWGAGASLLNVGQRPDAGKQLAAETTLDLKAEWRVAAGWSMQARLLNATNENIEPARDYQGLGRQAWIGLRYEVGP